MEVGIRGENQYAKIAEPFKESRSLPIYTLLETPTHMKLLGNLGHGMDSVVDLACGEGYMTRKIKALTKGRVVGIDISPEMIALAKKQEVSGGPEYLVGDCCQEINLGMQFDVVSAAFLLNYSSSKEMLLAFCKNAHGLLKPEGQFIGSSLYPYANTQKKLAVAQKYGFFYTTDNEVCQDGDKIYTRTKDAKFTCYYWSPETYDWAFKMAGFRQMTWIPWKLDEGVSDQAYWEEYLQAPTTGCFQAIK